MPIASECLRRLRQIEHRLYPAIQEQLGLKLEATKAMTDVIVIDHVEKPSAN